MTLHAEDSVTIIYTGEINRTGYEKISVECEKLKEYHPKKVNLVLSTFGGDPDAGFRIARCLQHYFTDGITLFVPHYCKSAGTLIAIGASELVLSDRGELGPLDVQLVKSDEMFERSSGMDIIQGFNVLTTQAYDMFNTITVNLKVQSRLSTKLASEAASQIVVGAFSPIFSQIDPLRLGEIQRATEIAFTYGNLLKEKFANLQDNGVRQLVAGYPSHGFVIDRKEASKIFKSVRSPSDEEDSWLKDIDAIIRNGIDLTDVLCVTINSKEGENNDEQPVDDETTPNSEECGHVSDTEGFGQCSSKSSSREQGTSHGVDADAES